MLSNFTIGKIEQLTTNKFTYNQYIDQLLHVLKQYNKAAKKFIDKVETGKAKSVETYNDLKKCYELSNKVINGGVRLP